MSNFSRIQCAVDFSDASLAAFEYGLALAKAQSAELSLVFAVPLDVRFNWRARERMDLLAELRRLTIAEGVPVSVNVQQGDPAEVILLHARARKPDALVIGTHGRIGMERFRCGSVAARVVQGAPCPTFVVRAFPSDRRVERFGRFDRILCATDFSAASGAALNQAIDLIRRGKRLTLLHVLRRHPFLHARRPWNFVHTDAWPRIHQIVPSLSPDLRGKVHPGFRKAESRRKYSAWRQKRGPISSWSVSQLGAGSTNGSDRPLRGSSVPPKFPFLRCPSSRAANERGNAPSSRLIYGDRVMKDRPQQSYLHGRQLAGRPPFLPGLAS